MPKKRKRGKRRFVCLTEVVREPQDTGEFPTPYSDPLGYGSYKKKRFRLKKNPRLIIYVIETKRGEFHGVEVDSAKELEFTINEFKKRGEFQSINGPFNTRSLAEEAVKLYMKG